MPAESSSWSRSEAPDSIQGDRRLNRNCLRKKYAQARLQLDVFLTPLDCPQPAEAATSLFTLFDNWTADNLHQPWLATKDVGSLLWASYCYLDGSITPPLRKKPWQVLHFSATTMACYSFATIVDWVSMIALRMHCARVASSACRIFVLTELYYHRLVHHVLARGHCQVF